MPLGRQLTKSFRSSATASTNNKSDIMASKLQPNNSASSEKPWNANQLEMPSVGPSFSEGLQRYISPSNSFHTDLEKQSSYETLWEPNLSLEGDWSEPTDSEISSDQYSLSSSNASSNTSATLAFDAASIEAKELEIKKGAKAAKEIVPVPQKRGSRVTRYLRYNFWSSYRKSFAAIFTLNMIALVAFIGKTGGAPLLTDVGSATSANLMVCLLFRQENFVNLLYEIFAAAPHSLPLSVRRRLAKVFHYGGCHSGCGVAAVSWYMLYTVILTKQYVDSPTYDTRANLITTYILVAMFGFILGGAHPTFRRKYHDYFEAAHRFAGWIALATFWTHSIFAAKMVQAETDTPLGLVLVSSPNFWFLCVSTSCTLLSWSRLRRRQVFPEKLSDHATRLHFKYRTMAPFYGVKLSTNPAFEWHAFATIPEEDGSGFSVVVSNAGDWTKKAIMNPSKKLWIRGYPLHGLLYTSKLFKRIVVVATGSGIGPCLSLMFADVTPRRVLWSTPNPETTYGDKVVGAVKKADPEAVIWNTRTQGRPNMVEMCWNLVQESGAEAVFIISNPKVTFKVVYGMETRGVPAYGAIFDS